MPQLLAAAKSNAPGATRVVNLTSLGHRISPVRFSDYNLTGKDVPPEEKNPNPLPPIFQKNSPDGYNGWVAYGQAKTANILFSIALNERLKGKGVASYAVHPGCKVSFFQNDAVLMKMQQYGPVWLEIWMRKVKLRFETRAHSGRTTIRVLRPSWWRRLTLL
jgi:NAD(P)-dependent dehydrogenase (short-subunit alcohol dehydrogenase family)